MKAIGILWNSMNNNIEDAITDISKFSKINEIFTIDFKEYFPDFISKIYPYTGTELWKLDYKIQHMHKKYDNNSITILFLNISVKNKKFIERKEKYIYEQVEDLKKFIRNKYKTVVDGYAFDNVFHMTDDEEEYSYTLNIIINFILNYYQRRKEIINLDAMIGMKNEYLEKNLVNGKRNKIIFADNKLIYKEQKENTFESFAEIVTCQLLKKMNIEVADYYLSEYSNNLGVVTRNFIKENEKFFSGTQIINMYIYYMETQIINFDLPMKYDIETIMKYNNLEDLTSIFYALSDVLNIDMMNIVKELKKVFALDMILLQSDRNTNNWGIIYNKINNSAKISPLYDNSNIMLLNNSYQISILNCFLEFNNTEFIQYIYNNSITLLTEKRVDNYFTPKNILLSQITDDEIIEYLSMYISLIKEMDLSILFNNIDDYEDFIKIFLNALSINISNIENILENKKKKLVSH